MSSYITGGNSGHYSVLLQWKVLTSIASTDIYFLFEVARAVLAACLWMFKELKTVLAKDEDKLFPLSELESQQHSFYGAVIWIPL